MAISVYVVSAETTDELLTAFAAAPDFVGAESTGQFGFSLIDADFYRSPQDNYIGERLNIALIMQVGVNKVVTPHYTLKIYKSDIDGNAIAKFQVDKTIHDLYPYRVFDMTNPDPDTTEDQVLGVIFRDANFEVFPTGGSLQESFNVAPQADFPSMTFAAEATGIVANDGVTIPPDTAGFAFLYDSNGQRVRDFSGYGFADVQVEGQVPIFNVHPTVSWASGVRGLVTTVVRFTEETIDGAPIIIGMPNCCP